MLNGGAQIWEQRGTKTRDGYGGKVQGVLHAPADIAIGKKSQSDDLSIPPEGVSHHICDTCRIESSGQPVDGDAIFYLGLRDVAAGNLQSLFAVRQEWRFAARSGSPTTNLGSELAELKRMPR